MSAQPKQIRGFALWDVTLFILLAGVSASLALNLFQARSLERQAAAERALLQTADAQLRGFAASRGRLPCADTDGDGWENCESGGGPLALPTQKGDLPYRDLGLDAAMRSAGIPRVGYYLYRNEYLDLDLGAPEDKFNPTDWQGISYGFNNRNDLDLCSTLAEITQTTADYTVPHLRTPEGDRRAIAYGLVLPGLDRDGFGDPFDGVNKGLDFEIEAPHRPQDANYDDQVLTRTPSELFTAMSCAEVMASVHAASLAVEIFAEVNSQKIFIVAGAAVLALVNAIKVAVLAYKAYNGVTLVTTATTVLGVATTALKAAIAACATIVGCVAIAWQAAAVASAAVAVAAAAAAAVAYTAAIVPQLLATGMTTALAIRAGLTLNHQGLAQAFEDLMDDVPIVSIPQDVQDKISSSLVISIPMPTPEDSLAKMLESVTSSEDKAVQDAQAVAEARAERDAAQAEVDTAESQIQALVDTDPNAEAAASAVAEAKAAAAEWVEAQLAAEDAAGRHQAAQNRLKQLQDALTELNPELAAKPDDADLKKQYDELQQGVQRAQQEFDLTLAEKTRLEGETAVAREAYLSRRTAVSDSLAAQGEPVLQGLHGASFDGTLGSAGGYLQAYARLQVAQTQFDQATNVASRSQEAANAMREAYDAMKAEYEKTGDVDSRPSVSIWAGPRDLLKKMDERGVYP